MAGNKKSLNSVKKSNGRKQKFPNSESFEEDSIFSKKNIYKIIGFLIVSVIVYQLEQKYSFFKQTQNLVSPEQQPNPLQEPVDTSKVTPNFIKPYIEEEYHPNPNVRNLPSDLSKWPPGEMGKYSFMLESGISYTRGMFFGNY